MVRRISRIRSPEVAAGPSHPARGERQACLPYILVRHKVADYGKWKPAFDAHGATREKSGSKSGPLFRNADDPNELIFLMEFDDLDKGRQFAQSDDLRETMQRAGVSDHPDVYFLEQIESVQA